MKIFLDQNIPYLGAGLLRDLGHEASHATELGKSRDEDVDLDEDGDLMAYAVSERMVTATRDKDFHEAVVRGKLTGPSTILLRRDVFDPAVVASVLHAICLDHEPELNRGCRVTVSERTVRIRLL